jgi:oligopeptidase A
MFIRFQEAGLLNSAVGKSYRDLILATGGTKDSMEVLVQFLGRNPDVNAFLIEIGNHYFGIKFTFAGAVTK